MIDEADKLCEMGFLEQLESIINFCQQDCLRYLFSATMQPGIEDHVRSTVMGDRGAIRVQIGVRNSTASTVEQ